MDRSLKVQNGTVTHEVNKVRSKMICIDCTQLLSESLSNVFLILNYMI